jgi:hypothetical protein
MTSIFKWMLPSMDEYIYRIYQVLMYSLSINLIIGVWQLYSPVLIYI